MNQKNKKYFYSEIEDQVIVNFIKEDFLNRQQQRKQYELTWELNLNFYLGNQFSYISNAGEINDVEKQYYWENREVFNHIAPIIEARLSKLNKVKPLLNIRPSSGSDKDIYSAKLAKSILQSTIDECSLSSIISTALYNIFLINVLSINFSPYSDKAPYFSNISFKVSSDMFPKFSTCFANISVCISSFIF